MKKFISIIGACVGALVLAAGIALPSAAADPTNTPSPNPTAPAPPASPQVTMDPICAIQSGKQVCTDPMPITVVPP